LKVLVTGGTGFVGTHLVNALLRRGHAVVVLARDPERARNRYNRPVEVAAGNVLDAASVAKAAAGREFRSSSRRSIRATRRSRASGCSKN